MDLISVEQEQGQKFKVMIKGHGFSCDLSEDDGGKGEAPSPTNVFVGALGACIGLAIQLYCSTHDLPSDGISVSLTYQFEEKPTRIGTITGDIELPEGFPEERRAAVMRVVKACPVHNTLVHPPTLDLDIV